MPTLGPFFKWLRPNHWKHVAIGPQSLGNNQFEDPEARARVWPRPGKTTSDDTLLADSRARSPDAANRKNRSSSYFVQARQEQGPTPREMDRAWMRSEARGNGKGDLKDEIELAERETGSRSS